MGTVTKETCVLKEPGQASPQLVSPLTLLLRKEATSGSQTCTHENHLSECLKNKTKTKNKAISDPCTTQTRLSNRQSLGTCFKTQPAQESPFFLISWSQNMTERGARPAFIIQWER